MQVPELVPASDEFGEFVEEPVARMCDVKVYVRNTGTQEIAGVVLTVQATWPIILEDEGSNTIAHLPAGSGTPCTIGLRFSYAAVAVPPTREVGFWGN